MHFSLVLIGLLGIVNVAEGYVCKCRWQFFYGNGHCYLFATHVKSWSHAEAYCRQSGGYLVKVNDGHEHNWLRSNAKKLYNLSRTKRTYWLGGTDSHQEGHWKWNIDFSPVKLRGWSPGQPDNAGKSQHCATMWPHHNYSWDDNTCTKKKNYICESPAFGKPACKCDA